ncbi:hypothetical protein APC62_07445 [Acinetobacter pittii]|uniref:hypothetical protein n=1 Tax=Acinetobacter pittii TaxID=48296 RepID=UPI00070C4F86|nr:hypothetical protein [Acinetobacter pittii]KRI62320.1 hypothetical protein APC62_07445 [Acinetobacter pittii]
MDRKSLLADLLAIYAIILTICIALYAIFDVFKIDKSTATNLLVWSATLLAPISIFYGFRSWKIQLFDQSKINAVENIKKKVSEFNKVTLDYRLYSRNLYLLLEKDETTFKKILKEWVEKAEFIRREIMSILEIDGIYFDSSKNELKTLYKHNDNLLELINEIENAEFILFTCWIGSASPSPLENGESKEIVIYKYMYLLDPSSHYLKHKLSNKPEILDRCQKFEDEIISTPIREFFKTLNEILQYTFIK